MLKVSSSSATIVNSIVELRSLKLCSSACTRTGTLKTWPAGAFLLEDETAVLHLLEVTAGLDSMVLGDAQILSQVKDAYKIAAEEGVVGSIHLRPDQQYH